jgi:hypothetical protein
MSGGSALPSLSDIETLNVTHLTQLTSDFTAEADLIQNSFTEAHELLSAAQWEGQANDAALHRTDTDRVVARGHAERLHEAADIARFGSEDMLAARQRVLQAVSAARDAGFTVNEDLSVTDSTASQTVQEYVARQDQAKDLAETIREHAATLAATDQNIAAKLSAATTGLGDTKFSESPIFGQPVPLDSSGDKIRQWTDKDLYPHDPTAADIHQDLIGDCYFDATAGAIANANPQWIKDRIHYDEKTGNFDVTLWDGHQWKHLPVTQDDINTDIAKSGASWLDNGQPNAALWPSVLEAAYAKMKYPDRSLEGALGDKGIGGGGYAQDAMAALTGNRGTTINPQNVWFTNQHIDQDITTALANHQPVTISTTPHGAPLEQSHVYTVEGITGVGSDAQLTLRNPWETNTNTPINTPEPLVTVRLGDLIGSGLPDPFGGTHPMSDVNIGSLG